MENSLNFLSTRAGFNSGLRHFKTVNGIIKSVEKKQNLADIVNVYLESKKIEQHQISPIINALLNDKYGYYVKSFNMGVTNTSPLELTAKIKDWNAFDVVLSYFHPQLGQVLVNPKNEESWELVDTLKENELVVLYVGKFNEEYDKNVAIKYAEAVQKIANGEKVTVDNKFKVDSEMAVPEKSSAPVAQPEEPKPAPVAPQPQKDISGVGGKKKMSPQYGITVSNELFHNGNVEAWKKIIRSYENKYPDIKVFIFYEGEQIHDINTLFKWGKVKHGTNIYIRLLGTDFSDISKLRRYLKQGASSRYEDFLKGDPLKDLILF